MDNLKGKFCIWKAFPSWELKYARLHEYNTYNINRGWLEQRFASFYFYLKEISQEPRKGCFKNDSYDKEHILQWLPTERCHRCVCEHKMIEDAIRTRCKSQYYTVNLTNVDYLDIEAVNKVVLPYNKFHERV